MEKWILRALVVLILGALISQIIASKDDIQRYQRVRGDQEG